ncbi:MAG: monovalent cation/H+ antiporter complex subunit F [Bacillota bacterium]
MIAAVIIMILFSIILTFYRIVKGPTVFDRIAAADTIGIMFLLILVLLSLFFDREIFIDVAIVYALLLFTDTLIMAKYFSN